jgi:PleD family two-component response regulator
MKRKRILIIDNDVADLERAQRVLEGDGYEVFGHIRAYSATEIARQLRPDLILLDVNRRNLTGEKLHAVLRASDETRDIPVVFWSSDGEEALRASAKRFGARGYVVKGSMALLRHCVARVAGGEIPDQALETPTPNGADGATY